MEATQYQRWMWTWLSRLFVCRFYITQDAKGRYTIHNTSKIFRFLYYFVYLNAIIKVIYLILTYRGWTGVHVGFLDQMSMWDWFLCFIQVMQESFMWYRKRPLFEIIHANWTVQEDVYRKLGQPKHVDKKITATIRSLMKLNVYEFKQLILTAVVIILKLILFLLSSIVLFGCGALAYQFYMAPKFALNTYALFDYDHWALRPFFAAHEYFFMFHAWIFAACSMVLIEVFSITYTALTNEMTQVLRDLSKMGRIKQEPVEDSPEKTVRKNSSSSSKSSSPKGIKPRNQKFIPDRIVNPDAILPGTQYSFNILLRDYKKIMIAAQEFNGFAGKLMGGIIASIYTQFVSDVFNMIQQLKEPDVDWGGVAFFIEDPVAGMTLLIRMLILMSRHYTASEGFIDAYRTYLHHDHPRRRYLVKYEKTMRIVGTRIGGYLTNPTTVPKGINALMNFYIQAAMWKRPDASTGRRT